MIQKMYRKMEEKETKAPGDQGTPNGTATAEKGSHTFRDNVKKEITPVAKAEPVMGIKAENGDEEKEDGEI